MPMHTDRRRRGRIRQRHSDLDWFAEDPWAEPDLAALEQSFEDDWYPGLWEPTDEENPSSEEETDPWDDDDHDGWGPVRPRRKRRADRR